MERALCRSQLVAEQRRLFWRNNYFCSQFRFRTALTANIFMIMDERAPDALLMTSPPASPAVVTRHGVGVGSTASLIAQQRLNGSRKAFLTSSNLPATHDFRKRANDVDGTLTPTQPDGTPRKAYESHKIPKPRSRKDKEAAGYFLARHRLVNMWNGKWTRDADWDAWDKTKEKMERQFGNYRLVEQPPPLKGWQAREYERRERKRRRERNTSGCEPPSKKRRHEKDRAGKETPFPTPEQVLAATPMEGIRMELLLAKFYQPQTWDIERFSSMLYEIGTVNKFTKMFVPGKRLGTPRDLEKHDDMPVDHARLSTSPGNVCIRYSRVEAY